MPIPLVCEFKDPTLGFCSSIQNVRYTNSGLYLCIDHRQTTGPRSVSDTLAERSTNMSQRCRGSADFCNGCPECIPGYKSSNTPEPPPLPNPGEPTVLSLVVTDLQERAEHGLKKYGQYLTAGDGRDHLKDAYQEAMDLVMYLRQEIRERELRRRTPGDALGGGNWK